MAKKKATIFYETWFDGIENVPEELQGLAYRIIMRYAFRGEEPADNIDWALRTFFYGNVKEAIDTNEEKRKSLIEKRKNAANSRWTKGDANASFAYANASDVNAKNANASNSMQMHNLQCNNKNINDNVNENINININNNELSNDNDKEDVLTNMEEVEKPKKKIFVKPTIEEVAERMREKGYTGFTAEQFWNFYESKGWMVGKNPMKDWRAALVTWVTGERRSGRARAEELLHFPGENDPHAFDKDAEMYNNRH